MLKKLLFGLTTLTIAFVTMTTNEATAQCDYGRPDNVSHTSYASYRHTNFRRIVILNATTINSFSMVNTQTMVDYNNPESVFVLYKGTSTGEFINYITHKHFTTSPTPGINTIAFDDIELEAGYYYLGTMNTLMEGVGEGYAAEMNSPGQPDYNFWRLFYFNDGLTDLNTFDYTDVSTFNSMELITGSQHTFPFYMSYVLKDVRTTTVCSDSIVINNQTYRNSTTLYTNLSNETGCDSVKINHLIFDPESVTRFTEVVCDVDYTWPITGQTYTSSGIITHTQGVTEMGCDSTYILDLRIKTVPSNEVHLSGNRIVSLSDDEPTFTWHDCNNDNELIEEATGRSLTPARTGSYAVNVTLDGCTVTSECIQVDYLGTNSTLANLLNVYPNPTSGKVNIDFGMEFDLTSVQLFNVNGQLVNTIATSTVTSAINFELTEEPGIYFLTIAAGEETRTVRLIKQ